MWYTLQVSASSEWYTMGPVSGIFLQNKYSPIYPRDRHSVMFLYASASIWLY